MDIIITAPSLEPKENVSGVSSVVKFIIDNNKEHHYIHFELGKKDRERGGVFRLFPLLKALGRWRCLLEENREAVVHYSFPLSTASVLRDPLFMWMVRRRGMRMMVHVHGGLFLTAKKIPWLQMRILKRVFAMSVPFIALSDGEVQVIRERFGAKDVSSLPNCVDLHGAESFQREVSHEVLNIGYLGRIAETKGMGYLLAACGHLKRENVPFTLYLAGKEEREGEYLPRFERLLDDRLKYAGVVSGKEKTDFLKLLDIFVLPSYFEGLPMSLLECMSFGVVPLTTAVGSIPQYVKDGDNGLFIEKKDAETIVSQIKRLNDNRDLLSLLGSRAKETVFKQFSPSEYVKRLNALYQKTAEKRV